MIVAIVILSILLVGATAFIFWLLGVLKNTFEIVESTLDMAAGRTPRRMKEAYDGKYYPATVISQIQFGCDSEAVITDFSMYEDKKIIGFILQTKETALEYIGANMETIEEEEVLAELEKTLGEPTVFKNVLVYAPMEGMWTWKSAQ